MFKRLIYIVCFIGLAACTTQRIEINIHKDGMVEEHVFHNPTLSEPKPNGDVADNTPPQPETKPATQPSSKTNPKYVTQEDLQRLLEHEQWEHEYYEMGCKKFVLPQIIPPQPIPKDIQEKHKMPDDELIKLLTEYARTLRITSITNAENIKRAYAAYIKSCKK